MKSIARIFLLFIVTVFISNPIFAETEKRDVSTFTEISLRVPGKLYVKQGSTQSVEITAKSETLEKLITEVQGRKLVIKFPNKNYFWKNFKPGEITINITVEEIDGLAVSGSGDIVVKNKIESKILDLAVSGSGDISLDDLEANRVKCSISGSGDISIGDGGVAEEVDISISGSGDVNTSGFEAENVRVKVAGSGDSSVFATKRLEVKVAGSGDVHYKGSPNIDSSIAGSGRLRKM